MQCGDAVAVLGIAVGAGRVEGCGDGGAGGVGVATGTVAGVAMPPSGTDKTTPRSVRRSIEADRWPVAEVGMNVTAIVVDLPGSIRTALKYGP
jgi:hypothetical protein